MYQSKEYQEQNNEVVRYMVDEFFTKNWKPEGNKNFGYLEIYITPTCNLGCKYCYVHHFGHKTYPKHMRDDETIFKNTEKIIDWLIENDYKPGIDLFTGEMFAQDVCYRILDMIYDKYKNIEPEKRITRITIPTNFTFIHSEELTQKVQTYIDNYRSIGIDFYLSGSIEGKYMEQNRPYIKNLDYDLSAERNDEYYDKCFKFAKKNNFGFHPMIYSNDMHLWKDNFLWFQEMFVKHDIRWKYIYLLQVRNMEWTPKQCDELREFVRWLVHWTYEKVDRNADEYAEFVVHKYGFNILKSFIGRNGRGLPCAIQSTLYVRAGDLAIVPCHRLMYPNQEYGKFIVENDKIVGVEAMNPELMIGVLSHDKKNSPYCATCSINQMCTGGCLGSQYEITGDPFTPIPSMCAMQHALSVGLIQGMVETGVYNKVVSLATPEQMEQIDNLRGELGI